MPSASSRRCRPSTVCPSTLASISTVPLRPATRILSILLFKSVGRTRPLDDRAERFLNKFGGHHWIVDAEKLGLGELDESVAEYFNALLMHPVSKQLISAMGDVRMHPMSYRRYMWKFEY